MSKSKEAWAYANIDILDIQEVAAIVKLNTEEIIIRQKEGSFPQPFTDEGHWDANDIYGWLRDPASSAAGKGVSA